MNHSRDFLDESDEILSPKYQLKYTLGCPMNFEGGELRWCIHAAVHKTISDYAAELREEFGNNAVEIEQEESNTIRS